MKKWFGYGWMALMLVACTLDNPTPTDQVCLVTELVQSQQQQEVSRQMFQYQNGKLIGYTDQTANRTLSFRFNYAGGKVASAYTSDQSIVLSLEYDEFERIIKASYLVDNKERTVFSLHYASNDRAERLVKIVETRVMLPTNSFIASRTFQFSYREVAYQAEDLVSESVQNGYRDGSRSEEEFTFEQDAANHSPFYDASQPIVLALLALTNQTDSNAARYLQRFDCRSFTHQVTDSNGTVVRQEANRFSTEYDGHFNPLRSTRQIQISIPNDSAEQSIQYSYQYECIE
ncbi:hypothetical protein ACO2Q8_28495 [Larkinella sp. VNQ87]|uniref:hypothetical protein n=1 Tax=Larkinella sp. VNQ87 TaxID=3400921 RepID=UPI003BFC1762